MEINKVCSMSTRTGIVTFGCLLIVMGLGKAVLFSFNLARSDFMDMERATNKSNPLHRNQTGESDCLVGELSEEKNQELHIKTSAEVFVNVAKAVMGMWILYQAVSMHERATAEIRNKRK
ncbi:unnamed protein product [Orchesella dallaii]|uniref:Uncharacterized protein n=1 Tax=Orchesella dallaii TaxID=48710 RepID=A0ABP1RGI2_9HEXA